MFSFLERLRKQPLKVRKKIALAIAGAVTFFIFILWLAVFFKDEPAPRAVSETESPFTTIGASVGAVYEDATKAWNSMRSVFSGMEMTAATSSESVPKEGQMQ